MKQADKQTDKSILSALKGFYTESRTLPLQLVVVFLAVAILGILSRYFGSRRFFYDNYYQDFIHDPFYNLYEYLFWFGSEIIWYFIIPIALIYFVHRKPFRAFGLGLGDWKFGLKVSLIFYLIMLPIVWVASDAAQFQSVYPHAQLVKNHWDLFLLYEIGLLVYFIGWEYIWRGYMLFGLKDYTGAPVAILIQMIPFVVMHFGKPLPETFGSVIAAIALGALAIRTRSFWYCVLIHWTVMLSIDLFSTLRFRANIEGIGMDALANLFKFLFS
jgi:CAAX protease family protein